MQNLIAGRYVLISHGIYEDQIFKSTSAFLKGELIYSTDQTVSVLILFKENPQEIKDILSYVGMYKIKSSDEIEHHISNSSHSKLINTLEIRHYIKTQDGIILGKPLGGVRRFEAVWKRI